MGFIVWCLDRPNSNIHLSWFTAIARPRSPRLRRSRQLDHLHRQGRALLAGDGIYFHRNKIIHFTSLSLPGGKREKWIDSGNPWLLLVISKSVQMMPCKLKYQFLNKKIFFIFVPRSSLLLFMVHYPLKYMEKIKSCHTEVTCCHFIFVGVQTCIAAVGTEADLPLSYNLSVDYFLLFVICL